MKGRTLCVKKVENPCDVKPTGAPEVTTTDGFTGPPITEHPDPLMLPAGGCTDPNSDLKICAKQCDGVNYGRSMVTRQMFSKNFWVYKAVGANARQYAKAGFQLSAFYHTYLYYSIVTTLYFTV